jgi:Na+-transporting NADH:ubiquinone oxidoreductase subunit NqrD
VNAPGSKPPGRRSKPAAQRCTVKDAFIELLKVKSVITLMIIGVMSVLAYNRYIQPETFMTVASAVVTYYFTRKVDK